MNFMFDETQMYLQPEHERPASVSVFDLHGHLVVRPADADSPLHDEMISRPCVLDTKTAACHAAAIENHMAAPLYLPETAGEWIGLAPGGDAAPVTYDQIIVMLFILCIHTCTVCPYVLSGQHQSVRYYR